MADYEELVTSARVFPEEREVIINIFYENGERMVELETTIQKYDNACRRQGWQLMSITRHTDGSWVASTWRAPAHAISIGKAVKVKRVMTEEQRQAAAERLAKAREKKDGEKDED